jgi:hypothetical protein
VGAVNNPSSFVFEPRRDYSFYLARAGGYTNNADKSQAYVLRADGSSIALNKSGGITWDSQSNQWVSGKPSIVEAGDTVVVPDKLELMSWLPRIRDFTQILYQIAVGTGIVFRAF